MIRTFDIVTEAVLVIQPGVKITVECDNPADVTFTYRPPKTDDYSERETTMMEFLHDATRLKYLDKVVDMYNSLSAAGRKHVMDSLEWTKYKREYFVRDFISAVNKEYSNSKHQKG
jgi:hypothetical protein